MLGYCRNGFWKAYKAATARRLQPARHKTLCDFISAALPKDNISDKKMWGRPEWCDLPAHAGERRWPGRTEEGLAKFR
jgi:hypothetical protein